MREPGIAAPPEGGFGWTVQTLIVGAGACGMTAALAARDAGQEVLIVERDALPRGSTALSAGLIPAGGTRWQAAAGIEDSAAAHAADIQKKAKGQNDPGFVASIAEGAAPALEWLADAHGLAFSLVTDFDYPGHGQRRMHGLPSRSGRELVDALRTACERTDIAMLYEAQVTTLHVTGRRVTGVTLTRPDGSEEAIGCARLILACNGFGGNRAMVAEHMPEIETALWFGHDGNRGEAVLWGRAMGAGTRHLGAYQGHGNVAHPHGILITWAVITEGGVQVNRDGQRFWNEAQGYSEAARAVMAQPGGAAWAIFDARIAAIARQFEDFRTAEAEGAFVQADTLPDLAEALGLPGPALAQTVAAIPPDATPDAFGRVFQGPRLSPPFLGVRVTGALFHTQGGLVVSPKGRVLDAAGQPFANLFAAGGAACGVSGDGDAGYLSGNGLLTAVVLGRAAGMARGSAGD
ncbi:FAD-dependent oxidoreductase [Oceanibium sediminis]|uniref:FAD-dependent oxidoreductase n=1 Tax=Oceanibium sediminis TaxID=2026339 RepID=UPI000DD4041D|nr:FAD-dependent oxidoreductase [Oceanibium sediminis]